MNNKENGKTEVLNADSGEIKSYVKKEAEPKKNKQSNKKRQDKNSEKKNTEKKDTDKKNQEKKTASKAESIKKETAKNETPKKETANKETIKKEQPKKEPVKKETVKKEQAQKAPVKKETAKTEEVKKESVKRELPKKAPVNKGTSSNDDIRQLAIGAVKILLPVAACAIVVAAIISFVGTRNSNSESASIEMSETGSTLVLSDEPIEENAHADVNKLMTKFYQALASGDMDTVRSLRDYNDDTEIIQYEKKSEFIESYDDIVCYTKQGLDDSSYFVYVSYDAKVKGVDTKAPGLNAFFVYTNDDGNLIIDGNMEDDVAAMFKLVTSQDDVVDLYNRVDVNYKEAIASDEQLDSVMAEIPMQIKTAVGEELAHLYAQNDESQTSEETSEEVETENKETVDVTQNQTVSQTVKTTDTVNVRSSDSETADKIGKAAVGTEIKRTEIRANGWSKVVFEGQEAFIKSDYLEVVSNNDVLDGNATDTASTAATEVSGRIEAITNVNVRQSASQNSEKLGTAVAGNVYDILGVDGEWYKINFNGSTGYVKAEFFEKR